MNSAPKLWSLARGRPKEHRIAASDWSIHFFPDTEDAVPPGSVEIHSDLSEPEEPGLQGVATSLIDREPPAVSGQPARPGTQTRTRNGLARTPADRIYAEIRYEDDTGPQLFLVTQNVVRVGRGADEQLMDLALYTNDEVSREHAIIHREPAAGSFFIVDKSTNGTWLEGRRLKRDVEQPLPDRAEIRVAEVLTLVFQVRR
jgi:hypothetical protein